MSYDLTVFSPRLASAEELTAALREGDELAPGRDVDPETGLTVVRGTARTFSFNVDIVHDPDGLDPEELDPFEELEEIDALDEVVAVYQVLVEGSAEEGIPHAVGFAQRLARVLGGVAVDQQTEETWS